jgi:hypothetical protein
MMYVVAMKLGLPPANRSSHERINTTKERRIVIMADGRMLTECEDKVFGGLLCP